MFKELMVMKALRYLLITFMVSWMALSAKAQTFAQQPQVGFQSTSSMVGSGSTLPQAAQTGAYTTYDWNGEIAKDKWGGLRREDGDGDGFEDDDDPDKPAEPFPIGDGSWALLALACAYLITRVVRLRKRALTDSKHDVSD